ncbi:lasso RiPP family leader peptide-containing protein [Nocardia blacklockiae]|nr:lasso RiPP family leader peptide-containing protein [Nocardia blacklockiae]MBF6170911.1 lasso RiPP family leader peptide-containing protein [Nocardia blacklockiae]
MEIISSEDVYEAPILVEVGEFRDVTLGSVGEVSENDALYPIWG